MTQATKTKGSKWKSFKRFTQGKILLFCSFEKNKQSILFLIEGMLVGRRQVQQEVPTYLRIHTFARGCSDAASRLVLVVKGGSRAVLIVCIRLYLIVCLGLYLLVYLGPFVLMCLPTCSNVCLPPCRLVCLAAYLYGTLGLFLLVDPAIPSALSRTHRRKKQEKKKKKPLSRVYPAHPYLTIYIHLLIEHAGPRLSSWARMNVLKIRYQVELETATRPFCRCCRAYFSVVYTRIISS